jgi:hypothetical protein
VGKHRRRGTDATGANDGRRRNNGAQPRLARLVSCHGWGLNWGLIALAELDLIAALTGRSFRETNVMSRTIYALIGLSGVWVAVRPLYERRAASPQGFQS